MPHLDEGACARSLTEFQIALAAEGDCTEANGLGCEVLLSQAACHDDLRLTEQQRESHIASVRQTVDELVSSCPAFAESQWFLMCEQTPCVLGMSDSDLSERRINRNQALCSAAFTDDVQVLTQYGASILIPMYDVESDAPRQVMEERWHIDKKHRWNELSTFVGFGEQSLDQDAIPARREGDAP